MTKELCFLNSYLGLQAIPTLSDSDTDRQAFSNPRLGGTVSTSILGVNGGSRDQ